MLSNVIKEQMSAQDYPCPITYYKSVNKPNKIYIALKIGGSFQWEAFVTLLFFPTRAIQGEDLFILSHPNICKQTSVTLSLSSSTVKQSLH